MDELRTSCRTPQGRLRVAALGEAGLFEDRAEAVATRLDETSEARAILEDEELPPVGGCRDLAEALALAEKGGVLESAQLLEIRTTLEALQATRRFFERRSEAHPALATLASEIEPTPDLADAIARCLDDHGEIRDTASPTLARARREAQALGSELKNRIERVLARSELTPHLSDHYYTVRNGRYVLPVKADSKGHVRGIVHDASRSGTTLFVEPDDMIDTNNRHRQAELTVEREILRVLRELSAAVGSHATRLRAGLDALGRLDLAWARGELSRRHHATRPIVEVEGIFDLPGLRHPLIASDECVANDLGVGRAYSVLILSGPNAGGKTVALKSIALAALFVRAGLHVPAEPGARVDLVGRVLADIGDHQDIRESLSTFSAAMASLARMLQEAGPDTLVCLDEVGVGTDPSEGAAIAQATLEALADSGARTVTTTHYNLLKEMAEVDDRFENASVEFDPETLAPTYRVRIGAPGASSATTVAARMGMPEGVLRRAAALLDREDRRLDRMLSELAASRAALDAEQRAANALRLEGEQARAEYRAKLARLQERRDKLFGEMRRELDDSFRDAHGEVARIIRELQRQPSSRRAARAREQLETLRDQTETQQTDRGLVPERVEEAAPTAPVDWPRARVGDVVRTPGGALGRLLSLPDRKGRVRLQVGAAKLTLGHDRLGAAPPDPSPTAPRPPREPAQGSAAATAVLGGTAETDLRGLRVDEALDKLEGALDLAAAEGRDELRIIHGIGTGALRSAVRERLPGSSHVVEWHEAAREEGGAGATRALLRKD